MPDERKAYRVEVTLHVEVDIGRDPERMPRHELLRVRAARAALLCKSLSWATRQLGLMSEHATWVYTPADLHEALTVIGELGMAAASAAGDQADYLTQAAGKAGEGGGR